MKLPFINWKEMPGLPGAKSRKVPWSVARDEPIDPHDPANWLPAPDPALPGGVVLSENDPYFLFDIDDVLLPDNTWHPHAVQLLEAFPGAAMEISHNGKGFHIMGHCDPAVLGERRNKFKWGDVQCEFYHHGRFVALGRGLQGNSELDWTGILSQLVPSRETTSTAVTSFVDQPVAEYTGPDEDTHLISMMINAKGSANQMFGKTATVKQLWECDIPVLSRIFPSASGDAFDRSSADAALMSHLAFWTGKNPVRMDRLFQQSGLMREKYEKRADYRALTLSGAINQCRMVYDKPKTPERATAPAGEIFDGRDQQEHFKGMVYVINDHAVMDRDGKLVKPPSFKSTYGNHEFVINSAGKLSSNAFEVFTESRLVQFPKARRTRFKPQLPFGVLLDATGQPIEAHYGDGVNVYKAPDIRTVNGDPAPFLDVVSKMLPDPIDQRILLSWCASLVQNPGVKFLWSPVLQGTKGNGKSSIGDCLTYAIGEDYSWTPKASKIDARFNSFLRNRIFVNVEEMHMFHKYEMLEVLKDYITGNRQEVEGKGVDAVMDMDYCANWMFFTNHKDAVIKEKDDRRFAIFFTAQQSRADMERDGMLTNDYWPHMWNWLRQDGFAIVRHFLLHYPIDPEYDPAGKCFLAPVTSSTDQAIQESYGVVEQYIIEAVESEVAGFRGGWVSTWAANKLLVEKGIKRSPRKLSGHLETLGYQNRGRATSPIMQEELTRPTLWSKPGTAMDYSVAQLYVKG